MGPGFRNGPAAFLSPGQRQFRASATQKPPPTPSPMWPLCRGATSSVWFLRPVAAAAWAGPRAGRYFGTSKFRYVMTLPKARCWGGSGPQGMNRTCNSATTSDQQQQSQFWRNEVSNVTTEINQFLLPMKRPADRLWHYLTLQCPGSQSRRFDIGKYRYGFPTTASNPLASARYAYDLLNIVKWRSCPMTLPG